MKSVLLAAFAVFALQAHASDQPAVDYPSNLTCTEITNVFGNEPLETVTLDLAGTYSKFIIQSNDNDRFLIDLTDGDQITTYDFQRQDIADLQAGKLAKVRGLFTSGFVYADGEHVNSLTVVECVP